MIFEMLDILSYDVKIIIDDITNSVDIDYILGNIGEFVRTTIFPRMLKFDFTELRYIFTQSYDKKMIECACFYTYTHDVLLDIRFPCKESMLIKGYRDELKKKLKTLFDSLTKEFIEYCKQNSVMERDTKINKFIKEDK